MGVYRKRTYHEMSRTRQYRIYNAMIDRCYKESTTNYRNYGARGIKVCEQWRHSFQNFWEDMKDGYADHLSLDRIDNNKDYSKENCKWSTRSEQNSNTRRTRIMELDGESKTMREWANTLGVSEKSISWRVRNGWNDHEALRTPFTFRNKIHRKPKETKEVSRELSA